MEEAKIHEELEKHFPQFEEPLKKLIAENGSLKTYEEGDIVMEKGNYIRSTMLVTEGNIGLYRDGDDGNEFLVYDIGPGEACALSLICALKQERSELKARATERTSVILVPLKLMDELMLQYRSWYYFVLETYRNRFEKLLEVIDQVIFKGMDERLVFYLKQKTEKSGTTKLHITHQEIANDLNSSREVISRLMKKMEMKGMVKSGRNSVEVVRLDA
ncbi:MAG TPA: Crp/Fnr family transcriptional regulator [Bacteroidia bacterium]|nr:Crp/Fnr family transcriptional regulator [Bacteroidia bacterium]